jgi:hypothetical protein
VITYIHVASIISSSEQKAASMRWLVTIHLSLLSQLTQLQVARRIHSGPRAQTEPGNRSYNQYRWTVRWIQPILRLSGRMG